jgi:hypothetical protein
MILFENKIFSYHEILNENDLLKLPKELQGKSISKEGVLIRLLLGTIGLTYNYENIPVIQRINYSKLYLKKNIVININTFKHCLFSILNNKEQIDKYLKENRKNTSTFEEVLNEISYYFYYLNKKSNLSGFLHLYRTIEFISYSFPLIYVSKSKSYKRSYEYMKSFFSEKQESELKFLNCFVDSMIDASLLDSYIKFDMYFVDSCMGASYYKLLKLVCKYGGIQYTDDVSTISIQYRDLLAFIITLRNRFFHMKIGKEDNISAINVELNEFFGSINKYALLWISYIYFHILEFGIQNIVI